MKNGIRRRVDRARGLPKPNLRLAWGPGAKTLSLIDNGGFQSRNASTIHLVSEAIKSVRPYLKKPGVINIWTGDQPPGEATGVNWAYCKRADQHNITAIPDHVFWSWPEIGIDDYNAMIARILAEAEKPPQDPRLFWAGNPRTHSSREKFMQWASDRPDCHVVDITWRAHQADESHATDKLMGTAGGNFVTLQDHCRYRYLIDVEGVGWSARLKLLFYSGRPVFVQTRKWREFFFDEIVPFEHFIPVDESLDDLSEKLEWAKAHPTECARIARQAQDYAVKNLTRVRAIERIRTLLLDSYAVDRPADAEGGPR